MMMPTELLSPEVAPAWGRFLALWEELAAPPPFGIEWDEEIAGEVLALFRNLDRAGVPFADAFRSDMRRLEQAAAREECLVAGPPASPLERLLYQWRLVCDGIECDEDQDLSGLYHLATQLRAAGIEVPPALAEFLRETRRRFQGFTHPHTFQDDTWGDIPEQS